MSERDPEMMRRAQAFFPTWLCSEKDWGRLADFAAAEVRRKLIDELERLRAELSGDVVTFSRDYERGALGERRVLRKVIDARLRELRGETEQGPGNPPSAGDTAQTAAKDAGSTPAPGTSREAYWHSLLLRAHRLLDEAAAYYLPPRLQDVCGALVDELAELPAKYEQSEVAAGSRAPERVENAQADLPAPASSRYTRSLGVEPSGLSGDSRGVLPAPREREDGRPGNLKPAPASSRHDKPGSPATDEALAPKETLRQPGGADLEAVGSERLTRGSPAPLFDEATLRAEIARVWGPAVAPAPSDAALERALREHGGCERAEKLRAASAKPAQEPDRTSPEGSTDALRAQPTSGSADWIERMVREALDTNSRDDLTAYLRARLGPVKAALEGISGGSAWNASEAKRALSILRGKVKP